MWCRKLSAWLQFNGPNARNLTDFLNQSASIDSASESIMGGRRKSEGVNCARFWAHVSHRARPGQGNLLDAGAALLRPCPGLRAMQLWRCAWAGNVLLLCAGQGMGEESRCSAPQ